MSDKLSNLILNQFAEAFHKALRSSGVGDAISKELVTELIIKINRKQDFFIGQGNLFFLQQKGIKANVVCPYCQSPIIEKTALVFCEACGIPHHAECWSENGCCAVFGCGETKSMNPDLSRLSGSPKIDLNTFDLGLAADSGYLSTRDAIERFASNYPRIYPYEYHYQHSSTVKRSGIIIVLIVSALVIMVSILYLMSL
jgi:hypothetical protein